MLNEVNYVFKTKWMGYVWVFKCGYIGLPVVTCILFPLDSPGAMSPEKLHTYSLLSMKG